jgi:hypothetical protein
VHGTTACVVEGGGGIPGGRRLWPMGEHVQRYCATQQHGEANCCKWRFHIKIRASPKGNVNFFLKKDYGCYTKCWSLVLKCYESRTRQHKMLMVKDLRPLKHYFP